MSRRSRRGAVIAWATLIVALGGCSGGTTQPAPQYTITILAGNAQTGAVGQTLPSPFVVQVLDPATGRGVAGAVVSWSILAGGGRLSADTSLADQNGEATSVLTLGTKAGLQLSRASVAQVQTPVVFGTTVLPGAVNGLVKFGGDSQTSAASGTLPVPLVVETVDGYGNPVSGVPVHWQVIGGGAVSNTDVVSNAVGLAVNSLTLDTLPGVEVVYATTPDLPDTVAFHATAVLGALLVAALPIPPNYGIHDTFIRDGIAFVCAWNSGVYVYDVGNGIKGGTPRAPVLLGTVVTADDGVGAGADDHNAWWFWNPVTGEKKYLFVGQEGPGVVGASSSGDIHVVDVSDLTHPTEVATFHVPGAGTHNFWMDERHQILYAAYYNGGVVSIDVSGTLSGDISSRLISEVKPGGLGENGTGDTYTWGVQFYNGSLYAIDMLSGLWQLSTDTAGHLAVASGGDNEPSRYSSDLSLDTAAGYAYTGTWDRIRRTGLAGSLVDVWDISGSTPTIVDVIQAALVSNVSDVKVSPDAKLLMYTTEGGSNSGFYFYSLTNPAAPTFLSYYQTGSEGVHTGKWAVINGRLYAFGAKNPGGPAGPELLILDVTALDR